MSRGGYCSVRRSFSPVLNSVKMSGLPQPVSATAVLRVGDRKFKRSRGSHSERKVVGTALDPCAQTPELLGSFPGSRGTENTVK